MPFEQDGDKIHCFNTAPITAPSTEPSITQSAAVEGADTAQQGGTTQHSFTVQSLRPRAGGLNPSDITGVRAGGPICIQQHGPEVRASKVPPGLTSAQSRTVCGLGPGQGKVKVPPEGIHPSEGLELPKKVKHKQIGPDPGTGCSPPHWSTGQDVLEGSTHWVCTEPLAWSSRRSPPPPSTQPPLLSHHTPGLGQPPQLIFFPGLKLSTQQQSQQARDKATQRRIPCPHTKHIAIFY